MPLPGGFSRTPSYAAVVPKAPLDALVIAFDAWLGSSDDDADAALIEVLGDFIERLGVKMPTTGEPFRNPFGKRGGRP